MQYSTHTGIQDTAISEQSIILVCIIFRSAQTQKNIFIVKINVFWDTKNNTKTNSFLNLVKSKIKILT